MPAFTAVRDLSVDEVEAGGERNARQAAFREALDAVHREIGHDIPQDHSIDEVSQPDGAGGLHIEVTLTLP